MVCGLGVHVIEVSRVGRALSRRGRRLERKLFSGRELADCSARRDRMAALAGRLAAKGACVRALGTRWSASLTPDQLEVRRSAVGKPELFFTGKAADLARQRGVRDAKVSLSHDAGLAVAIVVLED